LVIESKGNDSTGDAQLHVEIRRDPRSFGTFPAPSTSLAPQRRQDIHKIPKHAWEGFWRKNCGKKDREKAAYAGAWRTFFFVFSMTKVGVSF